MGQGGQPRPDLTSNFSIESPLNSTSRGGEVSLLWESL